MKSMASWLPAVAALLLYVLLGCAGNFSAIHPGVWGCVATLFVSAILLSKEHWWGCLPGLAVGVVLLYMSTQYTGQVLEIERPLGILLCVYYGLMGGWTYRRQM
ncbi:MAG: hypothetical protein ACOX7F_04665 [Eubacteriales bacterium]